MPTYEAEPRFQVDFDRLTSTQREAFLAAVAKFVADLKARRFRKGLRVKPVEGHPGVWEMTWAADGRATFTYGEPVRPGTPHIVWRRVGSHDIFRQP